MKAAAGALKGVMGIKTPAQKEQKRKEIKLEQKSLQKQYTKNEEYARESQVHDGLNPDAKMCYDATKKSLEAQFEALEKKEKQLG